VEFSLSWLAELVDLGDRLPIEVGPRGRCALRRLDDAVRRESSQLGEKLTAAGLAVESIREVGEADGGPEILFDVDVTSNRPDAMCHLGLARDLAVALERPLRRPDIPFHESLSSDGTAGSVLLEDPEGCPRYVARVIRGVKVGPSPEWLVRRLEAIGSRSINNVVDATNYVLWEMGQPLHAFDLATIPGGEIRVRRARAGERLTTLDGKQRSLDPEILVIADRERAIALAGIMGGLDTEVTARTTDVLLESAHFDRKRIRIGAKRLALHTDASHRFERGADFDACDEASRRCAALIVEVAGGRVEEPAIDAVARRPDAVRWTLDGAALDRFAGVAIADAEIERILSGLGFAPRREAGERRWSGTVPAWRAVDFEPRRSGPDAGGAYPQDLFEEVLRHVGYDRVPATLPTLGGVDEGANPEHERAGRARDLFAGLGYAEGIHYAFQPAEWDARFPALAADGEPLALANPLSERYAVLRRSLVPNLVAAAEANVNRGAAGVRLFETGHLFPGGEAAELEAFAWIAGGVPGGAWDALPEIDLFRVKGAGEALLEALGAGDVTAAPAELAGVVAGTGAHWRDARGEIVGWFGRVAVSEVPFPLFAAELLLGRLPAAAAKRAVIAPPRLPGIAADLTLTHALDLAWSELARALGELARPPLVGFRLKDRYRGAGVPAGAVATTITFDYHGGERTLTQDEVNALHEALAAELARRFAWAPAEER
jgi:phenylalanyl-tRNA synthetase beta chain